MMTSITAWSTAVIDPSPQWLSKRPVVVMVEEPPGWEEGCRSQSAEAWHEWGRQTTKESERENVFMVSDCRLHPAV